MGMNNFEDLEFEDLASEETISTSRGSNRTFLIVAGILGGILLIALLAIAAYALLFLPGRDTNQQTQVAEINATNTAVALEAQLTAEAFRATVTRTPSVTPEPTSTNTPVPTSTSTPVLAPTNTPLPEDPEATETVAALLTQQAVAGGGDEATPVPTSTALPDTGFADEFGVPGLVLIAGVLMMIIILSRRLRSSTA